MKTKHQENINPFYHPICLKFPKWLKTSGWIQHIPFAFYLVDIMKPETIVELGTHTGVSYCAFCQAVQTLELDTKCYAVDTWEGDPHTGKYGSKVYVNLKKYHDPLYSSFSFLLKKTFDDALSDFNEGSIDLLHIDGFHSFEAVSHDYHSWLPKMSKSGVIVFHDINVYKDYFGVWKLWKVLRDENPSFEFFHGSGLGILVVGDSTSSGILKVTQLEGALRRVFTMFFSLLGKSIDLYFTLMNLDLTKLLLFIYCGLHNSQFLKTLEIK